MAAALIFICSAAENHLKVLQNHQLLSRIFSFLDLATLKTLRTVSQFWSHEAGRAFREIAISLNPSSARSQELIAIFSFLATHRIRHTLTLSMLPSSWYYCRPEDPVHYETLFQKYYQQNNDSNFFAALISAFVAVPGIGDLVLELRFEVMLRNERDAVVFREILKFLPKLTRLSLDLLDFSDQGVRAISRPDFPPRITTLGLKVHRGPPRGQTAVNALKSLSPESCSYLLSLCPFLEFLDFDSWPGLFVMDLDLSCEIHSLTALSDTRVFLYFKGLRAEYIITDRKCRALTNFRRPLEFLSVRIYPRNEGTLAQVHTLLWRHSPTLRAFHLFWHPDIEPDLQNTRIELNYYFPKLKSLSLISTKKRNDQEFSPVDVDVFCCKDFVASKNHPLERRMPLLRRLELIFSISQGNQIYDAILPKYAEDGKELEFPQIKTFSCSITTAASDCESGEISRYFKTFPKLTTFQHVFRDEGKLFGCRHKIRNGVLVERVRSRKYVTESDETVYGQGYIDAILRPIIKMRPDSNEYFLY